MTTQPVTTAPVMAERSSSYRPDIDGLRALAVLPVVAFHAGFIQLQGGFVGVDVFFVISGFLITGILYREIEAGEFSLLKFYARRVRRIFPALFAVVAFTLLVGQFVLLPGEYVDLSKSATFTALSAANVYFQFTIDYFNSASDTKPLLHMWSLAVEEQFYLFFPLILLGLHRFAPRALRAVLVAAMALSFVAASVWVFRDQPATFYGPHFRAWELMVGGMLAIFRFAPPRRVWLREALSLAGVAAILGSIFLLKSSIPFPGLAAAPACIGAALIIWSSSNENRTLVSRALSLPPVRFVGSISYSLYLWHWPIIVFLREGGAFSPVAIPTGNLGKILAVGLSLIAAVLSWWFIERPFRTGKKTTSPRRVVGFGAAITAACCAVCGILVASHGLPDRFPAHVQKLATFVDYDADGPYRSGECFLKARNFQDYDPSKCLTHKVGVTNYMVVGDSHAAQYWWGLSHQLVGANVGQATFSECRNLLHQPSAAGPRCVDMLSYIYGDGLTRFRPDVLIIAGRWRPENVAELDASLVELKKRAPHVVLIGPIAEHDAPLPKLLVAAWIHKDPTWPSRHVVDRVDEIDAALLNVARRHHISYLSPYQEMCGSGQCMTTSLDGNPIQFDYGHLTANGSETLVSRWTKRLEAIAKAEPEAGSP